MVKFVVIAILSLLYFLQHYFITPTSISIINVNVNVNAANVNVNANATVLCVIDIVIILVSISTWLLVVINQHWQHQLESIDYFAMGHVLIWLSTE